MVTERGEELLGKEAMQKHMVAHIFSMSSYPVHVAGEAKATHHRRQNREGPSVLVQRVHNMWKGDDRCKSEESGRGSPPPR